MKIYDISQEVFGCCVYPGDPAPQKQTLSSMKEGKPYNLTAFSMCAHNGTHVDAPKHFIDDGASVDELPLEKLVGYAAVVEWNGSMGAADAEKIINRIKSKSQEAAKRVLLKGKLSLTLEAARSFADSGILLVGVESQTVGETEIAETHRILLGANTVILEGIRLGEVNEGIYLLSAAPLSLAGSDGAPVRAVLVDIHE